MAPSRPDLGKRPVLFSQCFFQNIKLVFNLKIIGSYFTSKTHTFPTSLEKQNFWSPWAFIPTWLPWPGAAEHLPMIDGTRLPTVSQASHQLPSFMAALWAHSGIKRMKARLTNVVFAEGDVWVLSLQSFQVPKWQPWTKGSILLKNKFDRQKRYWKKKSNDHQERNNCTKVAHPYCGVLYIQLLKRVRRVALNQWQFLSPTRCLVMSGDIYGVTLG